MYKYGNLVLNNAYVFVNMRCTIVLVSCLTCFINKNMRCIISDMSIKYALYNISFINNKIL